MRCDIGAAFLQNTAGLPHIIIIRMQLQRHERFHGQLRQIQTRRKFEAPFLLRFAMIADLKNPAIRAVMHFDIAAMAFIRIVPVNHIGVPIGTVTQVQKLTGRIHWRTENRGRNRLKNLSLAAAIDPGSAGRHECCS